MRRVAREPSGVQPLRPPRRALDIPYRAPVRFLADAWVARGLAIVEAVIGQLYLAVLVARLVSLYSAEEFAKYLEERTSRHRKE